MIDIFGGGPYLLDTGELFAGSLAEFGACFFHIFLCAGFVFLAKRFFRGPARLAAALLPPFLQFAWVWSVSIRSEAFLALCLAALLTGLIRVLELLPFQPLDYAFFFSALLFPTRLFNNTSAVMGHLWIFWILFCAVYAGAWLCLGTLKGNQLICYFLFVFQSLVMYSYVLFFAVPAPQILDVFPSSALGYAVLTAAVILFFLTAACLLRKHTAEKLRQLNLSGARYRQIENSFFLLSLLILLVFTLLYIPATLMRMQNAFLSLLIPVLCLLFLWAQLPFLNLLVRFALYRDSATFHEWEHQGTAAYREELDRSLAAVQAMRHDIKNIFFTMGNFVERSEDQEMKDFFWQNIYPYSEKTIRQSELLSQLCQIPTESLRAFFHLKFSQALQQDVSLRFQVKLVPEQFQTGMDIIDLTRVLGILLDNALEETAKLPGGILDVKIAGNEEGCSYVIKNTITEETRQNGIHPGKTSKGAGRGNGLRIVRELLERYPGAVLNSTLQDHIFVQSLNILYPR